MRVVVFILFVHDTIREIDSGVFAIEEISKTHISFVRTTVFQAVIISGVISQMIMGNYLYI